MKAKVYVFSDSVMCVGKMSEFPPFNVEWENKLQWITSTKQYRELDRIDGEPMEFEWMIFPGYTTLEILLEIQKLLNKLDKQSGRTRTIPRKNHLHVDVRRHRIGRSEKRTSMSSNSIFVASYAKKFSLGHWSFLGPGSQTKWNATDTFKPGGEKGQSCRAHDT